MVHLSYALGFVLALSATAMLAPPAQALISPSPQQKTNSSKASAQSEYQIGQGLANEKNGTSKKSNPKSPSAQRYQNIAWDDLLPKDWNPAAEFKDVKLDNFTDADPRAIAALKRLRKAWDNAPNNPEMHKKLIRIPGFIVPLDSENGKLSAFLLVPYFGGCLHTPPPPANQIIEVQLEPPQALQSMQAVWLYGLLENIRSNTEHGTAAYRLIAHKVVPYSEKQ